MKAIEILDIPSLKKYSPYLWKATQNSLTARMADYVFAQGAGGCSGNISFLIRMTLIRKVMSTSGNGFYGADLLGQCDELGGWMNGLSIAGIIEPTGNTREQFIDFGDGFGRMVEVKEWRTAPPYSQLRDAYDEIKMFVMDRM